MLNEDGGAKMLSINALEELGVNTKEGLERCLGKEDFYFKMIGMGINNEHFEGLKKALERSDLTAAFEDAHALKGTIGNLALTPVYTPLAELTELLRAKQKEGCKELTDKVFTELEKIKALL